MITLREAQAEDGPALIDLFRTSPVNAGTEFILDRSPDFFALLRTRGHFRTIVAEHGGRIAGTVTALWHNARDDGAEVCVGEVVDVRVATWARGSRVASLLLHAVRSTLEEVRVEWALCLIGDRNLDAVRLVRGATELPALDPLEHWASVHYVAVPAFGALGAGGLSVRELGPSDAATMERLVAATADGSQRLTPPQLFEWPDDSGAHRAWIAEDNAGTAVAGLVVWDGRAVRRIRVAQYHLPDLPLRILVGACAVLGAAVPLPPPGGALTLWASRWLGATPGNYRAVPALIRAALKAAIHANVNLLQVNIAARDPLLSALPILPRSTYWSTLYGRHLGGPNRPRHPAQRFHADLAHV